ncbi:MAG TPA: hypothetical protein PKX00_20440, partial [Opitutaceae bacterium]|nr:hypothetical protein [Opitutaceae bacterium]
MTTGAISRVKDNQTTVTRDPSSSPDPRADTGQRLYRRARMRIPGGAQLLGKRPEQFLPEGWPAYYQRAQGCTVWDLDGRAYVDFTS